MPLFLSSRGSSFCLAQLPFSTNYGQHITLWRTPFEPPPFYEWRDAKLPALYWQACWDVDLVRGATVFGNAFGELVACDFRISNEDVASYFSHIQMPLLEDEEVPPLVCELHFHMDCLFTLT